MSPLEPISIRDLAGFSEPAKELIKSISTAIGAIYEPRRIREKAKAEADSSIIKVKADTEIEIIKWQAQKRINHLELRRQRNINKIVSSAIEQLPSTINSEKSVDEDWMINFINSCQDIGNEELQILWAQVLTGETTSPGSFSYRTINAVKTLRQSDATLFKTLSKYVWGKKYAFPDYGRYFRDLSENDLLQLEYLNLIHDDIVSGFRVFYDRPIYLEHFNVTYEFKAAKDKSDTGYNYTGMVDYRLTDIGQELLSITQGEQDPSYVSRIIEIHKNSRVQISITSINKV